MVRVTYGDTYIVGAILNMERSFARVRGEAFSTRTHELVDDSNSSLVWETSRVSILGCEVEELI